MPLDANIILQGQNNTQSPMDTMSKALTLKHLMSQNRTAERQETEQTQMNEILKRNVTLGADGKTSLNRGPTLAEMYKVNPTKAMELQKMLETQDLDALDRNTKIAKNLSWSATPENWGEIRGEAMKVGLPNADKLPELYTPSFVQKWQLSTLSGEEQVKQMMAERDAQRKDEDSKSGREKTAADIVKTKTDTQKTLADIGKVKAETAKITNDKNGKGGMTAGQVEVDKKYADNFNDFTGGGRVKAMDAISKLKDLKTAMANDNGLFQAGGGPISGSLPDALRTQGSIAQRDNIVSVANSALKATFGGQLSDGERKALANEFYNDKLSNSENLKIIERKIAELENALSTQDKKAQYFQARGSLKGFKALEGETQQQQTTQNGNKPAWAL
jgi:hypothetical protein